MKEEGRTLVRREGGDIEGGALVQREGGDIEGGALVRREGMVPQLTHEKSSACLASSFGNTACLSKRSSSSYMFPYMNPVVQRHITYYWVNMLVCTERVYHL